MRYLSLTVLRLISTVQVLIGIIVSRRCDRRSVPRMGISVGSM
jgi:hypothetical protein